MNKLKVYKFIVNRKKKKKKKVTPSPDTGCRVGGVTYSLCLEDLTPLSIWLTVRSILIPQKSEVDLYTAGPQHEAAQMDGVSGGL